MTELEKHAEIRRLAALNEFEYETVRRESAAKLGMRVSALDDAVRKKRGRNGGTTHGDQKKPAEWKAPEAIHADPVSGSELVSELAAAIRRFVHLSANAALALAVWILFTWVFDPCAEINTFLHIQSPTRQCGKSTLFKVLKRVVRCGWIVARISPSTFIRKLDAERCTLFLDEGDAYLTNNETMRNLLDGASDQETAAAGMSVKIGDEWTPTDFNFFTPIAIASIGALRGMDTVEDRCITIHLRRASPKALKQLSKGRRRELDAVLKPLAARCARWGQDNREALVGARPELPETLAGREQDKIELPVAIADRCDTELGVRVRAALVDMSEAAARRKKSRGDREWLLADIRDIFTSRNAEQITSTDLCNALVALELRPWKEWGRQRKPITAVQIARLLDDFDIDPRPIRMGDEVHKGYAFADFADAFANYLPDPDTPKSSGTEKQEPPGIETPESDDADLRARAAANGTGPGHDAQAPPDDGIPSMLPRALREALRLLGYTDEGIDRMPFLQCHEILRAELRDHNFTDAEIRELTPARKLEIIRDGLIKWN